MAYDIYHTLYIKAGRKEVFDAVSDPKELVKWWPEKCSGEQLLGEIYTYVFTEAYRWKMEVTRYEPGLAFSHAVVSADEDWAPTSFHYELSEHKGMTKLEFSHVNWASLNNHFKHSSWSWAVLLKGLKDYLEKAVVIPFEERA